MRHPPSDAAPPLVMQHPDWVINASRSPFLLLTKTPSFEHPEKARTLTQPTSGISEMATEVKYNSQCFSGWKAYIRRL